MEIFTVVKQKEFGHMADTYSLAVSLKTVEVDEE
jgi:hypothetical protein